MNNKTLIAFSCFIIGGLLVLKFFNIHLSGILSFFLPVILIICGVIGLKNGKKIIGSILLVIGTITLLGKLGGILMLLIAILLIAIGVGVMKGNNNRRYY